MGCVLSAFFNTALHQVGDASHHRRDRRNRQGARATIAVARAYFTLGRHHGGGVVLPPTMLRPPSIRGQVYYGRSWTCQLCQAPNKEEWWKCDACKAHTSRAFKSFNPPAAPSRSTYAGASGSRFAPLADASPARPHAHRGMGGKQGGGKGKGQGSPSIAPWARQPHNHQGQHGRTKGKGKHNGWDSPPLHPPNDDQYPPWTTVGSSRRWGREREKPPLQGTDRRRKGPQRR